jgi:hypothetical protein
MPLPAAISTFLVGQYWQAQVQCLVNQLEAARETTSLWKRLVIITDGPTVVCRECRHVNINDLVKRVNASATSPSEIQPKWARKEFGRYAPGQRKLLYTPEETSAVFDKMLAWTLVEYPHVFALDSDVSVDPVLLESILDRSAAGAALERMSSFDRINENDVLLAAGYSVSSKGVVAFTGGSVWFIPSIALARSLYAAEMPPLYREPRHTDQSVLNHYFRGRWMPLPTNLVETKNAMANGSKWPKSARVPPCAIVHATGQRKPQQWFERCAKSMRG